MPKADEDARRRQLGAYLRAHRERLAPEDVGLPRSARRRTPGLRREEVAATAGVGVAWYAWLEQGRVSTSRDVLDALAKALRMNGDARSHLLKLAGFHDFPDFQDVVDAVDVLDVLDGDRAPGRDPGFGRAAAHRESLAALIDAWPATPALVLDAYLDVVAWNAASSALWRTTPDEVAAERRNLLLMLLTDPAFELAGPGGESVAVDLFRHFRAHADLNPEAPRVRRIQDRLAQARPDLAAWWECRSVAAFAPRTVTLSPAATSPGKPSSAEIRFDVALLAPVDGSGTTILAFTPRQAPFR